MTNTATNLNKPLNEIDLMAVVKIEKNSSINQTTLTKTLNTSHKKINYRIKALIDIGFLKPENFHNSQNRLEYLYFLIPECITITIRYS